MKGIIRKTILGNLVFRWIVRLHIETAFYHRRLVGRESGRVKLTSSAILAGIKNRIPWRGLKSGTGNLR